MSRTTIRAAVVSYLGGNVAGITNLYSSFPKMIPASAFAPPGTSGGAVACVFIPESVEHREAVGGATSGWKKVDYTVEVQLFHRWTGRAATGGDAALDATADLDGTIDNLKARIRADRTLASTAVWQSGETELSDQQGEPNLTGDIVETWAAVRFQVSEFVQT